MESPSQKIIQIIVQIQFLLNINERGGLAEYYYKFFEYNLEQLRKPHDLKKISENILKAYGGMGTFGDIVLQKGGKLYDKENDIFSNLQDELFDACREAAGLTSSYYK